MNFNFSQNSIEGVFLSILAIVVFWVLFKFFDTVIDFFMNFSSIKNKYPKFCNFVNKHKNITNSIKFIFLVFLTFIIWNYSIYLPLSSDSIIIVTIFFIYQSKKNNDKKTLNEIMKILIYSIMIYFLDKIIKDEPQIKISFNSSNLPESFLNLSLFFTFFKAIFYTKAYITAIRIITHNINLNSK
ncbi:hypothetical protein [Fusobacterium polymorphum]|uniref:hypothetical protein n=1 Tax=Fusobacterium nucleatum subsp. polymorphum TaxID=76857 RepID=UPI00300B2356